MSIGPSLAPASLSDICPARGTITVADATPHLVAARALLHRVTSALGSSLDRLPRHPSRLVATGLVLATVLVAACSPQDSGSVAAKGITGVPDTTKTTPPDTTKAKPPDTTTAKPPVTPVTSTGLTSVNTSAQYNPSSRHWPHIRVQVTDYRITYQTNAATRDAEYQWAGAHGDDILLDASDSRSVPKYRQYDPNGKVTRYVLDWSLIRPGSEPENTSTAYSSHMQQWYTAHAQYQLETAFLHDASKCAGGANTSACRVTFTIWNSPRWALNPGDAGARAYQKDRFREVSSDADGLFLDEHGSGDFNDNLASLRLVEYPNYATYKTNMVSWLSDLKAAVAPKKLFVNTATYISPWDVQLAQAAGGAHAEGINNPFRADLEARWDFLDALTKSGTTAEMVPAGDTPANYTAGNSATPLARRQLFQLASYYMVVPTPTDNLRFNWGPNWTTPFSTQWYKAIEVDVGKPLTDRHVLGQGTDPAGHAYRIWVRDFENAIVIVRPVIEWSAQSYDDATAMTITMPAGDTYLPLHTDGMLGAPTDRATVRTGESVILVRKSRLQAVSPAA
jgi:hypothetical protein